MKKQSIAIRKISGLVDAGRGTEHDYSVDYNPLFYMLIQQEPSQPFVSALEHLAESKQHFMLKIELMAKMLLNFYIENGGLGQGLMPEAGGFNMVVTGDLSPEACAKAREVFRQIVRPMEHIVNEGVSQGLLRDLETTKVVYCLINIIGAMVPHILADDVEATTHGIVDIFLYGISNR